MKNMSKYKVLFYYSKEDQAYITCVPELPGCMADGETVAEALENTKTVVAEWIETAKELGRDIPTPAAWSISSLESCDVAKYILSKLGTIKAMALEKLTYYCKVWSLVWCGNSLAVDTLEAWRDGPVFPELFRQHKGKKFVSEADITSYRELTPDEKSLADVIIEAYSDFDGDRLSEMTHNEAPWREARHGIPANVSSKAKITDTMIQQYYGQCAFA